MRKNLDSVSSTNNWITEDVVKKSHNKALKSVADRKRWEKGKKAVKYPHPTSPKCFIIKYE